MAKSFHQLSSRTQLIIFGLLCTVALAGAWQISIGPGTDELETRRAHLAKLEGEIVRVQAIADKLPALQREVKALTVSLRDTTAAIPEEKDPQDVLRSCTKWRVNRRWTFPASSRTPSWPALSIRNGRFNSASKAGSMTWAASSTGSRRWRA